MGAARGCFVNLTKLTHGTVLRFFIGKMDQETGVLWSKNGTFGTVLRFFQKIECNYKQFHLITILWLLWLNKLLLYKSNALCAMETMLKNAFVGFV